jgi:hypothetical protein
MSTVWDSALRGKAQAAALLGPGAGQHPDPLERARRQADRLPALDNRLDDGRFEEGQREGAADVTSTGSAHGGLQLGRRYAPALACDVQRAT